MNAMTAAHRGKLGFVLLSPSADPLPSTRISVLNIIPALRQAGYESEISFEPESPIHEPNLDGLAHRMARSGVTIAYFQKLHGASVLLELAKLRQLGIRTIYGVCDFVDNEMAAACDATVVVTEYLRSLYASSLHERIHVVHDGIERPELAKYDYASKSSRGRLRAVLVAASSIDTLPAIGRPPSFVDVTVVGRYPMANAKFGHVRDAWHKLHVLGSRAEKFAAFGWLAGRPFRKANWQLDTVYDHLINADVGIIPVNTDPSPTPGLPVATWQVRSENRLTLKMSLGLPVIASPVPSYIPVIEQGQTGYIANSRDEWLACFHELRDPARRESIGRAARRSVVHRFSIEAQAQRFLAVLDSLRNVRQE